MKRPIVGVVPLVDKERESLWMLPGYFDGLMDAGAIPVMLPLTSGAPEVERLVGAVDGLLLTGGQDVAPESYREERLPVCGETCPGRDAMERLLLDAALQGRDIPVLGICRGIQFINAALGGTLWQDLVSQTGTSVPHRQKPPYDMPSHEVELMEGAPLRGLLGASTIAVNSCHHQGIKDLSPRLRPMAAAPDGLIEAVWMPERRFVWAVQWHPEFSRLTSPESRAVFRAFADACRGHGG